jgi:hypothetical protein
MVSVCPSDEFISFRFRRMMPAIMFPPLSVARFMLIYIVSFGLSSLMEMSLFTENTLVAPEDISAVNDLPAC